MTRLRAALSAVALPFLVLASVITLPLAALAQAATTTTPGDFDPLQLLAAFLAAVKGGQWPVALVVLFVGLIWAVRKFGVKAWPWFATSEGGTVLAFLTTMAAVLGAAALVPGASITWALAGQAAAAAFAAIGAWTGARRLLRVLAPVAAKIPTIGPWLSMALVWLAGEPAAVQVQKAAEAAYKPGPAPSAAAAAAELGKPPAV